MTDRWEYPSHPCHVRGVGSTWRQAFEVQARLSNPVPPEPGEERDLLGILRHDLDNQFPASDGEAREKCVARVATVVRVTVRAIANHAWPPHLRLLFRNPLAHGHDGLAVL